MQSTLLSTLLSRMDRLQAIASTEEQFKIRDLDEAIRTIRRTIKLPWALKKGSLRVFQDVLEYPVMSDYDDLAYVDDSKQKSYSDTARFRYTSLKEFYEDPDNRNDLAEIWDQGTVQLGVRYKDTNTNSITLDDSEDATQYSVSGDATSPTNDTVIFKTGNGSVRVTITNSSNTATIRNAFGVSQANSNYKRAYHFKWVYLDAVPTSIEMRLQTDDTNYLSTTVTTQFSGQAFKADQWNLIAHDLNTATQTGTFDENDIASEKFVITGAPTGTYYFDESSLREWNLMDFWYYSSFNVKTVSSNIPDQDFFFNSSEAYSTDSSLVGDSEWADVVMYDAMLMTLNNTENDKVWSKIKDKRETAFRALLDKYPDMSPLIIVQGRRFQDDFTSPARL